MVSIAEMIVPDLHRRTRRTPDARPDLETEATGWTQTWQAWGTTASVTVTEAAALPTARRLAGRELAAAEKAAARYRKDAELHRLYRAGGRPITVSPMLSDLIAAALAAAERTGGDVDPTVAAAMTAAHGSHGSHGSGRSGRDRAVLPVCGTRTGGIRPVPGWQQVHLQGRRLQVPAGTTLDLSATATSVACDRAAAMVRARLGVGVLVRLGGDAASAGPAPDRGWPVTIDDRAGERPATVLLPAGTALATSHFTSRPDPDGFTCAQLIDPRTGLPPAAVWRMASAIGFTSLEASTYNAALVRGTAARGWLTQLWVPARLVTAQNDVITVGPWSAHRAEPTPATGSVAGPDSFPMPRVANPRRTTR